MAKFKAGDKVVATVSNLQWVSEHTYKKGDVFTVSLCDGNAVWFEGRGNFSYCAERFKLHTPEDTSSAREQNTANYHPHHDLIIAWAKGAKIQYNNGAQWRDWDRDHSPRWFASSSYRVKPEKTEKELEIERIESEMRKLADDLNKLKGA